MPAASATLRQMSATGSAVAAIAVAPPRVRRSPTSAMPTRSRRCMVQFSPARRPQRHADAVAPEHAEQHRAHHRTQGKFRQPDDALRELLAPWRARTTARAIATSTPGTACARPEPAGSAGPIERAHGYSGSRSSLAMAGRAATRRVRDHAVVELGDRPTAGAHEQKRQHAVHQAGKAGEHHAGAEADRARRRCWQIALPDGCGVLGEGRG